MLEAALDFGVQQHKGNPKTPGFEVCKQKILHVSSLVNPIPEFFSLTLFLQSDQASIGTAHSPTSVHSPPSLSRSPSLFGDSLTILRRRGNRDLKGKLPGANFICPVAS